MTNRCSYCYSDNPIHEKICISCNAPMIIIRPVLEKGRKVEEIDLFFVDYHQLKQLNNIDLLNLLKLAREAMKTNKYSIAADQLLVNEILQKKINLIENMIFDSMGRVPPIISDSEIKRIDNLRTKRLRFHTKLMSAASKKENEPLYHKHFKERFISIN